MLDFAQKLKTSIAIFCSYGLALPADKILQALALSISNSLWVELISFSEALNFAEQTSIFKNFQIKPPYPSSLASVNTRQVVNALGLNVYPL